MKVFLSALRDARAEIVRLRDERDMWRVRAHAQAEKVGVAHDPSLDALQLRLAVSRWLLFESVAPKEVLWQLCMKAYHQLCDAAKLK